MDSAELLRIGEWLNAHVFGALTATARDAGLFTITLAAALVTQLLFWRSGSRPLVRFALRAAAVLFAAGMFVAGATASQAERQRERSTAERLQEEKTMLLVNTRSASERAAALESQVRDLQYQVSQSRQSASDRERLLRDKLEDVQGNALAAARKIADISRVRDGLLVTLGSDALFDAGRSELNCEEREQLSRVIPWMQLQALDRPIRLRLTGHTDDQGPDSINDPLSYGRAKAVADYLVANAIPPEWVDDPVGKGRRQPRGFSEPQNAAVIDQQNSTAVLRAQNRRIEILISPRGQ